jgi:hypothetical protein
MNTLVTHLCKTIADSLPARSAVIYTEESNSKGIFYSAKLPKASRMRIPLLRNLLFASGVTRFRPASVIT